MLTRRGFWLLFGALVAFFPAALTAQLDAVIVPLGLLLWFGFLWTMHVLRATHVVRRLSVARRINGRSERRAVRWAGRPIQIETAILNPTWIGLPNVEIRDFVPSAAKVVFGRSVLRGEIAAGGDAALDYQIRFDRPGIFWLEGAHIEIVEPHGFFKSTWFVEDRMELLILPGPAVLPGVLQTRTFDDRKLGQGVHRLRAAGSSCELLEVRPYRPGDPPRSIAWKVSARRENLMTRDYESEVPVRCTMILDATRPMRVGQANNTPLLQATRLFATLAHRLMALRDPVGLSIADGQHCTVLKPGVGTRNLTRIHTALARAAALPVGPTAIPATELMEPVLAAAAEYRPQWLREGVNRTEGWWRGVRVFSIRGVLASMLLPMIASVLFMGRFFFVFCLLVAAILFLILGPKPGVTGRLKRLRKTAAAILALDSGGGAEAIARFKMNDDEFSFAAQKFLERWNRSVPFRLVGRNGRSIFEEPRKVDELARCVRGAVTAAHDREVLVIVADLIEEADRLKPLLDALRLATARGHLAILVYVCPDQSISAAGEREPVPQAAPSADRIAAALDQATQQAGLEALTASCRRLGVACLPLTSQDRTAAVVRRIERIRQAANQRTVARK